MNDRRPSAIRLRSVSKRFGYTWALRNVTMDLARGETLAMVGPNGAGKTTLIKILATLCGPSSGYGEILGLPLEAEEAIRGRTSLLAGQEYLYDELTGRENLVFSVRMSGRVPDEDRMEEALARVDLSRAAERRVRTYSTGMRKRLALGRLLLQDGELLLLDEPYAGLDRDGIELVDRIVAERHAVGRTVVLASHQSGRAVREADRAVLLERGRLHELPRDMDPVDAVAVRTAGGDAA